jgi:hypothetical protein
MCVKADTVHIFNGFVVLFFSKFTINSFCIVLMQSEFSAGQTCQHIFNNYIIICNALQAFGPEPELQTNSGTSSVSPHIQVCNTTQTVLLSQSDHEIWKDKYKAIKLGYRKKENNMGKNQNTNGGQDYTPVTKTFLHSAVVCSAPVYSSMHEESNSDNTNFRPWE